MRNDILIVLLIEIKANDGIILPHIQTISLVIREILIVRGEDYGRRLDSICLDFSTKSINAPTITRGEKVRRFVFDK